MKGLIGGLFLLASCASVMADDWVNVAASDESIFSIQKGSGAVTKNKGGEGIYVVVGRITQVKTTKITLSKWYVKESDCLNKQGQLVTLSLGGEYQFENDFVIGSGSIASSTAEFICAAYEYAIKEYVEKSI